MRKRHNDPFLILSLDLKIDKLLKLPAKSIARLSLVSKHWESIISSKYFIKLYMTRSLTQPRLLFVYNAEKDKLILDSFSQEDQSSDHQKVKIASHWDDYMKACNIFEPVHGLICFQSRDRVMTGNHSTNQFLTLLRRKTKRIGLFLFFGYDPVNEVYKVLCITVPQKAESPPVSHEYEVLTLGPKQKWKKITCKHPHVPLASKGICINGVFYYYARINSEKYLMCFDLTSEDFSVVKLSEDIRGVRLVNYNGKIAISYSQMFNATLDLWILEDAKKQKWSKVSHLVLYWIDLVGNTTLRFKGTLSTGQLVFAPLRYESCNPYFFISYNILSDTLSWKSLPKKL